MKLVSASRVLWALVVMAAEAAELRGRGRSGSLRQAGPDGRDFYLRQYTTGNFCTGMFVVVELTLDGISMIYMDDGKSPEVLCNSITSEEDTFHVHSCPGDGTGCPQDHCADCHEDMVKKFVVGQCVDGWMLSEGKAPDDCTTTHEECASKDKVDVGLGRWCTRWPTPGNSTYEKKTAEDFHAEDDAAADSAAF